MKKPIKIIIAGGRTFSDYELLKKTCDKLLKTVSKIRPIVIVSGTARGADKLGERYAKEHGYTIESYKPNWNKGNQAGYIRNTEMGDNADVLIAFWNGTSKGTKHMIDIAKEKGLQVRVIKYEEVDLDEFTRYKLKRAVRRKA
jgi:hypothetical protein